MLLSYLQCLIHSSRAGARWSRTLPRWNDGESIDLPSDSWSGLVRAGPDRRRTSDANIISNPGLAAKDSEWKELGWYTNRKAINWAFRAMVEWSHTAGKPVMLVPTYSHILKPSSVNWSLYHAIMMRVSPILQGIRWYRFFTWSRSHDGCFIVSSTSIVAIKKSTEISSLRQHSRLKEAFIDGGRASYIRDRCYQEDSLPMELSTISWSGLLQCLMPQSARIASNHDSPLDISHTPKLKGSKNSLKFR